MNDGVLDDGVPTITVMSEEKKLGLDEAVKQFSVDLKVPYCVVVDGSAVGKVWDRDMKPQFLKLVHAADCVRVFSHLTHLSLSRYPSCTEVFVSILLVKSGTLHGSLIDSIVF